MNVFDECMNVFFSNNDFILDIVSLKFNNSVKNKILIFVILNTQGLIFVCSWKTFFYILDSLLSMKFLSFSFKKD